MTVKEQNDFIRDNYAKMTGAEIAKILNLQIKTVVMRASRMGVSKQFQNTWTIELIERFKAVYNTKTVEEIAIEFNVTPTTIRTKARELGLGKNQVKKQRRIADKPLKPKPQKAITPKAKKDSVEEKFIMQYIKNYFGVISIASISRKLNISRGKVVSRAKKMGLINSKNGSREVITYSQLERDYVTENFAKMPLKQISEYMNKAEHDIYWLATEVLGLTKSDNYGKAKLRS